MHEAANKNYQERGVWKIGNNHVQHIKERTSKNERKYNIVTKDHFNFYFDKWLDTQND